MKRALMLVVICCSFLLTKAQVRLYQIGKYRATIDLYQMRMKWEKGKSFSALKEIAASERNTRRFEEIDKGHVVGLIEIYHITDGEHDGLYTRQKDQTELQMSILKIIKE